MFCSVPGKTWNMQIVYIFISTAGECSPAMLFLTLEPQGKEEPSGACGLSPWGLWIVPTGPVDCPHTAGMGWQCLSIPRCHPPMLWPWLYCSFVQIYPACPATICAVLLNFSPGIVCHDFSVSKSISPLLGHSGQGQSRDVTSVTTGLFPQPLVCSLLGFSVFSIVI